MRTSDGRSNRRFIYVPQVTHIISPIVTVTKYYRCSALDLGVTRKRLESAVDLTEDI